MLYLFYLKCKISYLVYHTIIDIAIYVVQIIDTPHKFSPYVFFTGFAFYIAVLCGFDKHLNLTSCLNAHNHNTCIRLPQTGCTARKMARFIIIVEDRQTQVIAGDAMATIIIID